MRKNSCRYLKLWVLPECHRPRRPKPDETSKARGFQTISDNERQLRQIDSDIERLSTQLAYLHRVRVQYGVVVEAERKRQAK